MITVKSAYEFGNRIPKHIYDRLPKICTYCESHIVLNDDFTSMRCSNPKCTGHGGERASLMFQKLKVKDFGPVTCRRVMIHNGITNHIKILSLTPDDFPNNMSEDRTKSLYNNLQIEKKIDLPFLMELCCIEGISGKRAERIIGDYNSFSEFFDEHPEPTDIANHIVKVYKRRKVTRPTMKMAINIWKAKGELIESEELFEINQRASLKIPICMTGNIKTVLYERDYIKPRSRFIELLNKKYEGVATFLNNEDSIAGSAFLLLDSTTGKKKIEYARDRNIPIMSFSDFMDLVTNDLGEGNPDINLIWRRKE